MMGYLLSQTAPLFIRPLPVWDYWWLLIIPLCIAIAIVYKSIKCRQMNEVPRQATIITLWILVGMGVAAALLLGIVNLVVG